MDRGAHMLRDEAVERGIFLQLLIGDGRSRRTHCAIGYAGDQLRGRAHALAHPGAIALAFQVVVMELRIVGGIG